VSWNEVMRVQRELKEKKKILELNEGKRNMKRKKKNNVKH
jgi:hypothetical protein